MKPKAGRIWAWIFPIMAGVSILFGFQGSRDTPLVFAFNVVCLVAGLVGTGLLFEFTNTSLRCGKCQESAPLFHLPGSSKQGFQGGWKCRKCGAELDRKGQPLAP
ncbi:hypothetical protein Pla8534_45180 [Lignipirellula cremea]|uniref:Uncharacterized protein n=1 Tax=Lignipirellula cremea TaxID=2528010 RepID=A0A518DXX7_9BACT|nr:hypothetical protein Pla8534_45180 [Lignipirellula cremea]